MMCLISIITVASLALQVFAVPAQNTAPVCKQLPYILLLPLSNFPAATSYCSSVYPLSPIVTSTTIHTTKTSTSVSVDVVTTTSTSTAVITPTAPFKKRSLNLGPVLSNLKSLAKNFESTACSCIEKPITVTSKTTLVSNIITKTTTTTTTTSLALTTSVSIPESFCENFLEGQGSCGCEYEVSCYLKAPDDTPDQVSVPDVHSAQDCANACDVVGLHCLFFQFDYATDSCTIYPGLESIGAGSSGSFVLGSVVNGCRVASCE